MMASNRSSCGHSRAPNDLNISKVKENIGKPSRSASCRFGVLKTLHVLPQRVILYSQQVLCMHGYVWGTYVPIFYGVLGGGAPVSPPDVLGHSGSTLRVLVTPEVSVGMFQFEVCLETTGLAGARNAFGFDPRPPNVSCLVLVLASHRRSCSYPARVFASACRTFPKLKA
jgi:hypothetical protein